MGKYRKNGSSFFLWSSHSTAFLIINGWFSASLTCFTTRSCSTMVPMLRAWVNP